MVKPALPKEDLKRDLRSSKAVNSETVKPSTTQSYITKDESEAAEPKVYKNRRDVVIKTLLRSFRRFFIYKLLGNKICYSRNQEGEFLDGENIPDDLYLKAGELSELIAAKTDK